MCFKQSPILLRVVMLSIMMLIAFWLSVIMDRHFFHVEFYYADYADCNYPWCRGAWPPLSNNAQCDSQPRQILLIISGKA